MRAALARVLECLGETGEDAPGQAGNAREGYADSRAGRSVLVRWADGILSGAIPAGPVAASPVAAGDGAAGVAAAGSGVEGGGGDRLSRGGAVRPTPAQTVIYRTCPDCRESRVETEDGAVSVSPERVAELAPRSNIVEIPREEELLGVALPAGEVDKPNSAQLSRKVLNRDGLRCASPACDRRLKLNAHHIIFRSKGGPTALWNELAVCDRCHAMLHVGLLDVSGSPENVLTWTRRPIAAGAKVRDAEALRSRLRELVATIPPPAAPVYRPLEPRPRAPYANPESPRGDWFTEIPPVTDANLNLVRDLAEGLIRLGWKRAESEERIRAAIRSLAEEAHAQRTPDQAYEPPSEVAILQRALMQ